MFGKFSTHVWRDDLSFLFNDFGKSAQLPTGETIPVVFLPEQPGEYEFTCQMGMIRGKLIVE